MKARVLTGFVALALFASSGCATITRGTKDAFVVETDPSGAQVSTSNGHSCAATPCTIKMPRRSDFSVTISKEGYETWNGKVTNQISGEGGLGMAGNVVFGGIIGAGVDLGTGAMHDLTPNPLVVKLSAARTAPAVAVAPPAPAPVVLPAPAPVAVQAAPAPVVLAAPAPVYVAPAPAVLSAPAPAPVPVYAAPAPAPVYVAPISAPALVQPLAAAPASPAPRGYAAGRAVSPPIGYAGYPSQSLQTGSIQAR